MNKAINCQRFKPPSEIEERELSTESPEETLEDIEARLESLENIYESQSLAAAELSRLAKDSLILGVVPTALKAALETEECLKSMAKTRRLCQMCQEEWRVKRDEEMAAIRNEP